MDGMAAMKRLEDSIISRTLRLQEYLRSANITEEDMDYYFNVTGLLPAGVLIKPQQQPPGVGGLGSGLSPSVVLGTGGESILLMDNDSSLVEGVDGAYAGCGMGLHKIRQSVHLVHGILSLIICLAGCLANIVNIVVLSRRELRRNAINRILCSLAVADFLLMLEYIPFACHMYLFPGRSVPSFYSYPWAVFVLFHAHFTLVAHTISIWLTLSLAFWRYEVLKNGRHQRRKNGRRCHQERCTRTIALAYIGSVLLCIPSFITFDVEQQLVTLNSDGLTINQTHLTMPSWGSSLVPPSDNSSMALIYIVNLNPIAKTHDGLIHKAHLWAYSVVMKLGPCLVLTVLTCWLVRRLWEAERHHQSLTAKLNADNRHHQEQQQQHQQGVQSAMPSAIGFLRTTHNDNQISLTQQLEMRQLNTAMNRDSGVQIIVTEAAATDNIEPAVQSIKLPTVTTTIFPGDSTSNVQQQEQQHLNDPVHHSEPLTVRNSRRKLSMVEFSSYVMSTTSTCPGRDFELESKMDGTGPIVTVLETDEHTTMDPSGIVSSRSQVSTLNSTKSLRHKHQTDRTTRMLVAVLILFLVTEIPQGIMALLSGVLGNQFFTRCYSTGMGEILDLLALLNSAINFLLYCSMSRQFRRAARSQFRRLFGPFAGLENCAGGSPVNCFFRPKLMAQPLPVNISPSNPTRCTQL